MADEIDYDAVVDDTLRILDEAGAPPSNTEINLPGSTATDYDLARQGLGGQPRRQPSPSGGIGAPSGSSRHGGFSGVEPSTPIGDPSFAEGLLALWRRRRELAEEIEDTDIDPVAGGGGGSGSIPSTYRYSPQSRPGQGVAGTSSLGNAPVRRPSNGAQQLPKGAVFEDRGPSLPPLLSIDPKLADGFESLKQTVLAPGSGQTFDFSDPDKLFLPGVTGPQVPLQFGLHRAQRGNAASSRNRGGSTEPFSGSTLGPGARTSQTPYWTIPGSRPGHEVQHPHVGRVNQFLQLPRQSQAYLRRFQPGQVPQNPINEMLERYGITPSYIAQVRSLRDLEEI